MAEDWEKLRDWLNHEKISRMSSKVAEPLSFRS
jgi:hypothetical protein